MSFRTPLGRVRGLGSAKSGTGTWWLERLTSLALVPLTLWFAGSLAMLARADYPTASHWLRGPINAVLLVLMLVIAFYHAMLGVQVILEDYVRREGLRLVVLLALKALLVLLAAIAVFAVLRVALGN
ncbi:MAG: succinate dehydrogenase, hydrophobic membrane anchor protein [Gammaproteobacteria bacterium]